MAINQLGFVLMAVSKRTDSSKGEAAQHTVFPKPRATIPHRYQMIIGIDTAECVSVLNTDASDRYWHPVCGANILHWFGDAQSMAIGAGDRPEFKLVDGRQVSAMVENLNGSMAGYSGGHQQQSKLIDGRSPLGHQQESDPIDGWSMLAIDENVHWPMVARESVSAMASQLRLSINSRRWALGRITPITEFEQMTRQHQSRSCGRTTASRGPARDSVLTTNPYLQHFKMLFIGPKPTSVGFQSRLLTLSAQLKVNKGYSNPSGRVNRFADRSLQGPVAYSVKASAWLLEPARLAVVKLSDHKLGIKRASLHLGDPVLMWIGLNCLNLGDLTRPMQLLSNLLYWKNSHRVDRHSVTVKKNVSDPEYVGSFGSRRL
ncbi:hypothetical protein KEM48_007953 [Puccinia striiformis f. sp. tritici PST-130]|uniref:Uncharacterized protein n=1 Tax=Puccinia striiformis f. sp. tritici PST-78 TaxID=1165861 RepID=A0A0L0UST4_9BASI|nr:hypothetical protein KEM48_007953 [Puccinia striiformis f. sp. tritici PST-130]KNE89819.1 hypothetical protein PSTG_16719 [Puccinia striiformis f. sp. tritici PST-78]